MSQFEDDRAEDIKRMSNVEFVAEMMNFSRYGALAQIFIIDAIRKHADRVAMMKPNQINHPLISEQSWIGVAKEIQSQMVLKYGEDAAPSGDAQVDGEAR